MRGSLGFRDRLPARRGPGTLSPLGSVPLEAGWSCGQDHPKSTLFHAAAQGRGGEPTGGTARGRRGGSQVIAGPRAGGARFAASSVCVRGRAAGQFCIGWSVRRRCSRRSRRAGARDGTRGPGAGPGVLPRVPGPDGRRAPHQLAVCAHGGRCRAPATVPSAEHVGGGWCSRGAVCERMVAGRWPRGAKRCPLWILSRWSSQTARARMVVGAVSPQPVGCSTHLQQDGAV